MTKKNGHQNWRWTFLSNKGHLEILFEKFQVTPAKWFLVPQTQGQVTAYVPSDNIIVDRYIDDDISRQFVSSTFRSYTYSMLNIRFC